VHDPVDEQAGERDLRIAVQQVEQDRGHHHAAEQDRGGDRHRAARRRVDPGGVVVDLLDLGEDAPAVGEIALAGVGHLHRAGGAVEQLGPESLLQLGDGPGDRRRRQLEAPGRRREAGLLGHCHEDRHGLQAVHL
jgi:hypothetical protein